MRLVIQFLKDLIPSIDPRKHSFSKEKGEKQLFHSFQARLYDIRLKAAKFNDYKIQCIQIYESSNTDVLELMK